MNIWDIAQIICVQNHSTKIHMSVILKFFHKYFKTCSHKCGKENTAAKCNTGHMTCIYELGPGYLKFNMHAKNEDDASKHTERYLKNYPPTTISQ